MPSIPAGVLIMSRSAFLEVMRYACGTFLGKKTMPPSDSSICWSSYQISAVPLIEHEHLVFASVFMVGRRFAFAHIKASDHQLAIGGLAVEQALSPSAAVRAIPTVLLFGLRQISPCSSSVFLFTVAVARTCSRVDHWDDFNVGYWSTISMCGSVNVRPLKSSRRECRLQPAHLPVVRPAFGDTRTLRNVGLGGPRRQITKGGFRVHG